MGVSYFCKELSREKSSQKTHFAKKSVFIHLQFGGGSNFIYEYVEKNL